MKLRFMHITLEVWNKFPYVTPVRPLCDPLMWPLYDIYMTTTHYVTRRYPLYDPLYDIYMTMTPYVTRYATLYVTTLYNMTPIWPYMTPIWPLCDPYIIWPLMRPLIPPPYVTPMWHMIPIWSLCDPYVTPIEWPIVLPPLIWPLCDPYISHIWPYATPI